MEARGRYSDDIAVIGLSCRFPGDASNPQGFWDLLCEKRSAYSEIPATRFNVTAFRDTAQKRLNTSVTPGAHFIQENIAAFDSNFFTINQDEAQAMDPQQRIMLEVVYEATENAGIPLHRFAGSDTSCLVGSFTSDYREMMFRDIDSAPLYAATGAGNELLSNRVSWFYDLRGPSYSVASACSSSLVALHVGCQSLRTGEAKMSIVGGSSLLLDPAMFVTLSNQNFLANDGLSKAFDARGNGYGRGEGIAAVILKPVDDAIRDGDHIRAVIRGTGVNQDGHTPGITLPSTEAQKALMLSTYRSAGLDPAHTNYFEAHGTGTGAGDPVELRAISEVFSPGRTDPLIVGAVKTNIGHLEAAAGIAALIKGIYVLENGVIPPNMHFQRGNPKIPFKEWNVSIPTSLTPWPKEGVRRLSINGFGYGGTNGHAIVDGAAHYLAERGVSDAAIRSRPGSSETDFEWVDQDGLVQDREKKEHLFVFSASDQKGIGRQKQAYATHLRKRLSRQFESGSEEEQYFRKLAFTLSERRTHLSWRIPIVASSLDNLAERLSSGSGAEMVYRSMTKPRLGFVFTGQGAQWAKMGVELLRYPSFRQDVEQSSSYLKSLGAKWSAIEELQRPTKETKINLPEYSQPICTVLQVALLGLLEAWDVKPSRVVGHSSGEIAAAYCLGVLSKEDALKIAYFRGLLSSQISDFSPDLKGSMMAVGASPEEAATYIKKVSEGELVVACVNSPSSVTISGDAVGINELETMLKEQRIFARKLKVSVAYHSPHMDVIAMAYWDAIKDVEIRDQNPAVQMYSSVTGALIDAEELGATYWVRNLTSSVQFSDAMASLLVADGYSAGSPSVNLLVEVGPHSALQGPARQIMKQNNVRDLQCLSCLSRDRNGIDTMLETAGTLFSCGFPVSVDAVNSSYEVIRSSSTQRLLVDLPKYSWDHSREFWAISRVVDETIRRPMPHSGLLGAPHYTLEEGQQTWRGFLRLSEIPWARDHMIQTSILYPAAGFIASAIEASRQLHGSSSQKLKHFKLRHIRITSAVVLTEDAPVEYVVQLRPHMVGTKEGSGPWFDFRVSTSTGGQPLRLNCAGMILTESEPESGSAMGKELKMEYESIQQELYKRDAMCHAAEQPEAFYEHLRSVGLVYGPTFRKVTEIREGHGTSCCTVEVPDVGLNDDAERRHVIHPATLDAMFHAAFAALNGRIGKTQSAYVPTTIEEVVIAADIPYQPGDTFKGFADTDKHGFKDTISDIQMLDALTSVPAVQIKNFCCTQVASGAQEDDAQDAAARKLCSKLIWKPSISHLSPEQQMEWLSTKTPSSLSKETTQTVDQIEQLSLAISSDVLSRVSSSQMSSPYLRDFYSLVCGLDAAVNDKQKVTWDDLTASLEISKQGHDSSYVELELLNVIRRNIQDILVGQIDTTALLGKADLRDRYFANLDSLNIVTSRLTDLIDLLAHENPTLSVLEVGGAARCLASTLLGNNNQGKSEETRFLKYVYSSNDKDDLAKVEKLVAPFSADFTCKEVDISSEPTSHDLPAESFDLIISSFSTGHMACNEKALTNMKQLLKPGGRLCLVEATNLSARNLTLGSACNWWSRETDDHTYGFMSMSAWGRALETAGLPLEVVSPDYENPKYRHLSLLVGRKPESPAAQSQDGFVILEAPGASKKTHTLAAGLTNVLSKDVECSRHTFAAEMPLAERANYIVLWEVDRPFFATLSEQNFSAFKALFARASSILWVTNTDEPTGAMVTGLARCVRNEAPQVSFRTLEVNGQDVKEVDDLASSIAQLAMHVTDDTEFKLDNGMLQTSRFVEDDSVNGSVEKVLKSGEIDLIPLGQVKSAQKLCVQNPGMLDTLCFERDPLPDTDLKADEVEIEVKATGLNFRDVMVAMGQIPDKLLGFEASGIITRVGSEVKTLAVNDKVCTIGHGSHRACFRNKAIFCQKIPEGVSFESAACLPLVHATAYHALVRIARVENGQSILIHAAAGGVGQAAIQLAKHYDMEIFATVGSPDKRTLIQEFYGIPDDHIFNSRDLSFAKGVMRMTNGRGVDCVLNSLAGEALQASWSCVAEFGHFVEIGIKDILGNTGLNMNPFLQDSSFSFLNLEHIQRKRPGEMAKIMEGAFDLLRRGVTRAVEPLTVYPISEVEGAFRLMQAGKHRGKIALSFSPESAVPVQRDPLNLLQLDKNATYVLVGGLGGLGRSLSHFLVAHGARSIWFISRSGAKSETAQKLVQDLESKQIRVTVSACDIADIDSLQNLVERSASSLAPVKGVIQCAMVLRDALFDNLTYQDWTESIRPKVNGTWNVHTAFTDKLDFFVTLSSFANIFGNRGQANYAAGCAFQDALAHHRRSLGFKAVTIDLGIMRDVGVLAEQGAKGTLKDWVEPFGIRESEFHALMTQALTDTHGASPPPAQVITGLSTGGAAMAAGISLPYYLTDDARFSIMREIDTSNKGGAGGSSSTGSMANGTASLKQQLSSAKSFDEAEQYMTEAFVAKIAKFLQTSASEIDKNNPLHTYGVDSLVAVEIKNWVLKEVGSDMTVFEILSAIPMALLSRQIVQKSKNLPADLKA